MYFRLRVTIMPMIILMEAFLLNIECDSKDFISIDMEKLLGVPTSVIIQEKNASSTKI